MIYRIGEQYLEALTSEPKSHERLFERAHCFLNDFCRKRKSDVATENVEMQRLDRLLVTKVPIAKNHERWLE